jgi:kynureninase
MKPPAPAKNSPGHVADPLLEWRQEFPTTEATLHFISHSLGAMPRGVEEALAGYARTWKLRGIRAWEEGWFQLPTEVGNVLARIFGAPPGTVSMHENATMAHAVALSSVEFTARRPRLVCTAEDFPSELYLFEGLARRGAEVHRVAARASRRIEPADVVAAIDERTAVVAVSLVMFRTSQWLDVAPIVARAREVGALTLIDGYQAVGTVPVDVTALGVDFLAGGSVKWLCGGPGAGYLYARPETAARLEPALTGWMAHENPFAFDEGPIRRDAGARRLWTGTPGIASFMAARCGYEIVAAVGVNAIRAKSLRQTGRMLELATEFGFHVGSPLRAEDRGGTVCLDIPHAEAICSALLADDVLLDYRPGVGLRLAPHFYTRDDEVERVMHRVREELARRSR